MSVIAKRALILYFAAQGLIFAQADIEKFSFKIVGKSQDSELQHKLAKAVDDANGITIKFRDPAPMHPNQYTKSVASAAWDYQLTAKCTTSCAGRFEGVIRALRSARKIDGACPNGFTVVIDFVDGSGRSLLAAFSSLDGLCVTVEEVSYVVPAESSLNQLMQKALAPLR